MTRNNLSIIWISLSNGRSLNYNYTWIDNVVRKPYWTPIVPRTLTKASTTDICEKAKKTQLRAHIDKIALYPQIPSYTSCILSLGKRNTPEMSYKQTFFLQLVFCFQNCSDLLWEKNVIVIEKNFRYLRLKAWEFAKIWDHWNNLF